MPPGAPHCSTIIHRSDPTPHLVSRNGTKGPTRHGSKAPVRVTVTGAAGQIGYSLLFRIASGQMLGPDQPVVLQLLEITPALEALDGVVMELDDCAFPLLPTAWRDRRPEDGLRRHEYGRCSSARSRARAWNAGTCSRPTARSSPQGQALSDNAAPDVRILVVGNPANTNCLIAQRNAPEIPADRGSP